MLHHSLIFVIPRKMDLGGEISSYFIMWTSSHGYSEELSNFLRITKKL